MDSSAVNDQVTVDPSSLDGVLALQVLLTQGLEVSVYPRQVLVARTDEGARATFAHGVPDTTILTSAMTAQNKRMRRALMERRGVPVPKGANFSIGRGTSLARKFAKSLGYPVVVKPGKGDVGFYNFTRVNNVHDLKNAIANMKIPVHERTGVFRASYTPMELGTPGVENGKKTVPASYRFLVEERVSGHLLRFLVLGDSVIAVIECDGSPIDGTLTEVRDVTSSVHPDLIEAVQMAAQTIPGLALQSIDVVARDFERPLQRKDYWVVGQSERPLLWAYERLSRELALDLSHQIIASTIPALGPLPVSSLDSIEADISLHSLPSAEAAGRALPGIAESVGLQWSAESLSQLEGELVGRLSGSTRAIAHVLDSVTSETYSEVQSMLTVVRARPSEPSS